MYKFHTMCVCEWRFSGNNVKSWFSFFLSLSLFLCVSKKYYVRLSINVYGVFYGSWTGFKWFITWQNDLKAFKSNFITWEDCWLSRRFHVTSGLDMFCYWYTNIMFEIKTIVMHKNGTQTQTQTTPPSNWTVCVCNLCRPHPKIHAMHTTDFIDKVIRYN